ncbi:MAG: hypothetical protein NWR47_01785 [Aestuariivirgaceae bacterium]|nr:hypothetical protein [Aestuariivirgaceae bacterium]
MFMFATGMESSCPTLDGGMNNGMTREKYRFFMETRLKHNCIMGDEAVHWLWKQWANVLRVRNNGIPIVGFTW